MTKPWDEAQQLGRQIFWPGEPKQTKDFGHFGPLPLQQSHMKPRYWDKSL